MKFTDDDLKRLKEYLANTPKAGWALMCLPELLARLKSAEKVCEAAHSVALALDDHANEEQTLPAAYRDELQDPLYYWRKSAGKES